MDLMELYDILQALVIVWNVFTFLLMGMDKRRAVKNRYRIPEKTLFFSAYALGGFGILAGMYVFHHKTKHISFRILIPLAAAVNVLCLYCLSRIFMQDIYPG